MGIRGAIAAVLVVSTGLLTGMATMPSGAAAGGSPGHGVEADSAPGLVDRVKRKACEVSLAATRRDRGNAKERTRECSK